MLVGLPLPLLIDVRLDRPPLGRRVGRCVERGKLDRKAVEVNDQVDRHLPRAIGEVVGKTAAVLLCAMPGTLADKTTSTREKSSHERGVLDVDLCGRNRARRMDWPIHGIAGTDESLASGVNRDMQPAQVP